MYKTVQHASGETAQQHTAANTCMQADLQGEKELLVPIAHLGQGRFWNLQLKLTPEQTTSLIFGLVDLDLCVMQATLDAPDVRLVDKDHNVLVFDPRQNSIEIWLHSSVDQGLRRAVAARLTRTLDMDSRQAVSAVMPRRSLAISFMRAAVTPSIFLTWPDANQFTRAPARRKYFLYG